MQTAWLHSWHEVQRSRLEGEALHLDGDMKEMGLWGLLLWPEMKSCHLLYPSCNNEGLGYALPTLQYFL